MSYLLRGTGLGNCHCHDICPCNVDLRPNGPGGECKGLFVINIREGNKDEIDLSGVNVVMVYTIPDIPSAGNWRVGLIVDSGASDQQASALESIFRGQEGGIFGDFSGLYGEFMGVQRARVTYSNGETPSATIEGTGDASFEPLRDMEGKPTVLLNAAFAMGPELVVGKGSGHIDAFGLSFDSSWGELSQIEMVG
jgi:hypothetical protein